VNDTDITASVNPPVEQRPALRVVSGNPTPEEIAALAVVLAAVADAGHTAPSVAPAGGWADPSLRLRRPVPPGPGAWRASAWH
jgi:hypothetical protein